MSQVLKNANLAQIIFNTKPSFKKKIKVTAARKGITMTEFITNAVEEKLTKNNN